jgi:AcrR family transcriptional regulator
VTRAGARTRTTATPGGAVGRPRDPDISRAILDATLELLTTEGYAGVSVAAVAERAGVHKPAVYRRWPSKLDLAVAAVQQVSPPARDPDTGDAHADLVEMLLDVGRRRNGNDPLALVLRLRAEISLDPELTAAVDEHIVAPRRAVAGAVITRGISTGTFRPDLDLDLATDALFGSLWARMLTGRDTLGRRDAERIVATLATGLDQT